MFVRADENVIDWLRPTTADRWRTYNIRDVDTRGVELGVRKTFASGPFVLAEYTALDVDAAAVNQLSKYVLDYAPHSFVAAAVDSAAGADSAPRRASSTVAARARRARSTTCCSMRASAVASGSTSSCSWTDATCSTRAIRRSPASRCRGPRWSCRWLGLRSRWSTLRFDGAMVGDFAASHDRNSTSTIAITNAPIALSITHVVERLLLRQAVQRAQAPHEIDGVNADHPM